MEKIGVLLLEEQVMIREAIRCVLEDTGDVRVVGQAGDAAVAVAECRRLRPSVLLMELMGEDTPWWYTLSEVLRVSPGTRVVVLSERDDAHSIVSAFSAGAHAYVPKRAALTELLDAIRWAGSGKSYVPRAISPVLGEYLRTRTGTTLPPPSRALTPRETQVFRMVAQGRSSREIGEIGGISRETVRAYRKSVMRKLGARSVAQLTHAAVRLHVVQPVARVAPIDPLDGLSLIAALP